jgi:hypothetical protein
LYIAIQIKAKIVEEKSHGRLQGLVHGPVEDQLKATEHVDCTGTEDRLQARLFSKTNPRTDTKFLGLKSDLVYYGVGLVSSLVRLVLSRSCTVNRNFLVYQISRTLH